MFTDRVLAIGALLTVAALGLWLERRRRARRWEKEVDKWWTLME